MPDFRHIVTTEEDGEEVRVLMRRHFDLSSRLRGRIKREHRLHLNGVPAEGFHRAKAGDRVPDARDDSGPGCQIYGTSSGRAGGLY